jgi:ribosome maturation factor RimP
MPTFLFGRMSKENGSSIPGKDPQPVPDRLQGIISPILWTLGLELVDVVCHGQGARSVVRVLIDKPRGVTITDCEQAHKALGPALDVADPFPHAYTLEVSSPGLDRSFKRLQDYQRAIGKEVNLKLRQPLEGQWRIAGRLIHVDEQVVVLAVAATRVPQTIRLDREIIAEAKLVVKI